MLRGKLLSTIALFVGLWRLIQSPVILYAEQTSQFNVPIEAQGVAVEGEVTSESREIATEDIPEALKQIIAKTNQEQREKLVSAPNEEVLQQELTNIIAEQMQEEQIINQFELFLQKMDKENADRIRQEQDVNEFEKMVTEALDQYNTEHRVGQILSELINKSSEDELLKLYGSNSEEAFRETLREIALRIDSQSNPELLPFRKSGDHMISRVAEAFGSGGGNAVYKFDWGGSSGGGGAATVSQASSYGNAFSNFYNGIRSLTPNLSSFSDVSAQLRGYANAFQINTLMRVAPINTYQTVAQQQAMTYINSAPLGWATHAGTIQQDYIIAPSSFSTRVESIKNAKQNADKLAVQRAIALNNPHRAKYWSNTQATSSQASATQATRHVAVPTSVGVNQTISTPITSVPNVTANYYVVQPGDSVWGTAHKFGITMADLINWNGIVNNTIHPGQRLIVKNTSATVAQPSVPTFTANHYLVRPGDSVWAITHKFGITMADLINWNGIVNNTIHPGQRLLVKNVPVNVNIATSPTVAIPKSPFPVFTANHHLVRPGETIQGLAQKYGITTQQFISWNNIVDNTIHPGQRVLVKNTSITTAVASPITANDYIIQPGDSVWRVSNIHGISMQDFISWNNIKNNTIHPNQRVIVKNPATITQTDAEVGYIVKAGDSVWRIANLFGMSMDTLVQLNQIANYTIHPGQRLVIQQARSSANSTSQSSQSTSSSGTTGMPNPGKDPRKKIVEVKNMHQFFNETEFGQKIKKYFRPVRGTNPRYQATQDIKEYGIKEGDIIYLDRTHWNHLEVFNRRGSFKAVINLDGVINEIKTKAGEGRVIMP